MVDLSKRIEIALDRLLYGNKTLLSSKKFLENIRKLLESMEIEIDEIVIYHPKEDLLNRIIHELNESECFVYFVDENGKKQQEIDESLVRDKK